MYKLFSIFSESIQLTTLYKSSKVPSTVFLKEVNVRKVFVDLSEMKHEHEPMKHELQEIRYSFKQNPGL